MLALALCAGHVAGASLAGSCFEVTPLPSSWSCAGSSSRSVRSNRCYMQRPGRMRQAEVRGQQVSSNSLRLQEQAQLVLTPESLREDEIAVSDEPMSACATGPGVNACFSVSSEFAAEETERQGQALRRPVSRPTKVAAGRAVHRSGGLESRAERTPDAQGCATARRSMSRTDGKTSPQGSQRAEQERPLARACKGRSVNAMLRSSARQALPPHFARAQRGLDRSAAVRLGAGQRGALKKALQPKEASRCLSSRAQTRLIDKERLSPPPLRALAGLADQQLGGFTRRQAVYHRAESHCARCSSARGRRCS